MILLRQNTVNSTKIEVHICNIIHTYPVHILLRCIIMKMYVISLGDVVAQFAVQTHNSPTNEEGGQTLAHSSSCL